MDKNGLIHSYHAQGFNCAQAVLAVSSELTKLPEKTALAVAGGLGGGCRCGEICGALSGSVLVLGMAVPHTEPDDPDRKQLVGALAKELCGDFRTQFGCVTCRELVEKYGGKEHCEEFMRFAAENVEKIVKERG